MAGEPRLLDWRGGAPTADRVEDVVEHLRGGGIVGYPTETVYGFGSTARARSEGLSRLRHLKGGRTGKPFLVLAPDRSHLEALAWSPEAEALAEVFWPGALTLILRDPDARFPPGVRSSEGTVAVRISPHLLVRRLLDGLGEVLTSTSANVPGGRPARSGEEALAAARELDAGEELWIVDGGPLPPSEPSTIIDCTGEGARVLRSGAVPPTRVRCVLPDAL